MLRVLRDDNDVEGYRYFHPCLLTRGLNPKGISAVEFDERMESEKLMTATNDPMTFMQTNFHSIISL